MLRAHEHGHRRLAGHGRKVFEEFIQRAVAFQMLEKRRHRDARAAKYRIAAEDFPVSYDVIAQRGGFGLVRGCFHPAIQNALNELNLQAAFSRLHTGSLHPFLKPFLVDGLVEGAFQTGVRALASKPCFLELLVGALGVAEVADGLLILPALFPRLAQTTRAGFARFDPALR